MPTHLADTTNDGRVVVGPANNFWIWSPTEGWDLTRQANGARVRLRSAISIECETSNVIVDTELTALLVIDMQNFALSGLLWNVEDSVLDAEKAIMSHAVPAARKLGIQVIWLNWGLTDDDLDNMPPSIMRTLGFDVVSNAHESLEEKPRTIGLGREIGDLRVKDSKEIIPGGRALMRGSWNAALHDPLGALFDESQATSIPDVLIHKNRNSGLWNDESECNKYLRSKGIKTLLFAGVNTDQCVVSNIVDAQARGYDAIMLRDSCATDGPPFTHRAVEFNCHRNFGFISDSKRLAKAIVMGGNDAVTTSVPQGGSDNVA
ncbi:Hypothetical protein D9617_13g100620 [Elsinoe fawcettii]|nr:Hypothetical protein D9617_13g100620 [Elsinoe fawcettii]